MPPYRGPSGRSAPRGPRENRGPAASTEGVEQVRGLIEYLARSLVDDREGVRVHPVNVGGGNVVFELTVAPDDMGRVIGKQGRVANAIRNLVKAAGTRAGVRASLEIV